MASIFESSSSSPRIAKVNFVGGSPAGTKGISSLSIEDGSITAP